METEIRETVAKLNTLLGEDIPYLLDVADPKTLKLLDKNARYMTHETYQALVSNIKRDKALTSFPLCYRDTDGKLLVLSGNHRVMAAKDAGLTQIIVLILKEDKTREELVAIQLSHNAIEGKDDPVILKELWSEIHDIDLKMYAGLDSELLKELAKMEFSTIAEAAPDFKQVILLFLPEEIEQITALMKDADILFSGDEHFISTRKNYDEVFKALIEVKERFHIVNNPTAFMKIIDMAKIYFDSLPPVEAVKKPVKEKVKKSIKSTT
jgi:hypothetical protein